MAKKRGAVSQPESEEEKDERDQIMDEENGDEDSENDDDNEGDDNDDDDEEMDDDDDDDEMDDGEEEGEDDAEPDVEVGSPSPKVNKGMEMRSGFKKRRRSKDTTGLTPPDGTEHQRKKRVRRETVKKPANRTTGNAKEGPDESSEPPSISRAAALGMNGAGAADSRSGFDPSSPGRRRISFSQIAVGPTKKDGAGQVTEEQDSQDETMVPPKMGPTVVPGNLRTNGARRGHTAETASNNGSAGTNTARESPLADIPPAVESELQKEDAELSTSKVMATQQQHLLTVVFMFCLAMLYFVAGPVMVKIADVLIPLDVGLLPPRPPEIPKVPVEEEWMKENGDDFDETPEVEFIHEDPDVVEETVTEVVGPPSEESKAWNSQFTDTLDELNLLKDGFLLSKDTLSDKYILLVQQIEQLRDQLSSRQERVQDRLLLLSELEGALDQRIDDEDDDDDELWSTDQWARLRALAQQTIGTALLDSDSIVLWEIPEIEGSCPADAFDEDSEEAERVMVEKLKDGQSPLFLNLLEAKESELMLRAQMTAERFMSGDVAEQRIRGWIKAELDKALHGNGDAAHALARLEEIASGTAVKNVDQSKALEYLEKTIQHGLEIDRADVTGVYDHASLMNGATVLYGGKRGTSNSLIDDLPIVNRILQGSKFRFYGFGPEVALKPTYPRNALGQCWSFRQTTLEEQLRERALFQSDTGTPDDFRRGSFGTLTIRLPQPVRVRSVAIEHPPMRLTDRSDSAIRSFRVVGYEDDRASSIAWNLGSFQYDIQRNRRNEYLQEFQLSTTHFGKEVPAFQSISLAVDSNWGHDYACLYRFRVHGDGAES